MHNEKTQTKMLSDVTGPFTNEVKENAGDGIGVAFFSLPLTLAGGVFFLKCTDECVHLIEVFGRQIFTRYFGSPFNGVVVFSDVGESVVHQDVTILISCLDFLL